MAAAAAFRLSGQLVMAKWSELNTYSVLISDLLQFASRIAPGRGSGRLAGRTAACWPSQSVFRGGQRRQ